MIDDEVKLTKAREAYHEAFGNEGPHPFGVSDTDLTERLRAAVESGKPIPANEDWYADLSKGEIAAANSKDLPGGS